MIDPRAPDYENTPASSRRPRFAYAPVDPGAAPLVSIVTPYYNTGPEFHETARCVFRQSLQQWEWLVIDDGSTDPAARRMLDEYRASDPRVRVLVHERNRGPSAARNTGFRAARAGYVFQLDSDDLVEPTALEKLLWFLETHPEYALAHGYSVGFGAQQYLWTRGLSDGSALLHDNLATIAVMLRRSVHEAVGGYDEQVRDGMEDWDFWLRCAAHGYWGATIPEFLDWYRRRLSHGDRWADLRSTETRERFRERLRAAYPQLYAGGFPKVSRRRPHAFETQLNRMAGGNRLIKEKPRLLMIVPWLRMGGADRFNLDVVSQLTARGWEVTIAATLSATHPWMPLFAALTPDVFALGTFLDLVDQPAFLRYLIESRRPDVVMVSNSEMGYLLLPFLRACCPEPAYVDYCHMEEEHWKNGGYPRYAVGCQELLDLNIVASEHLKRWMVSRGGDASRIEVAYINVDPEYWKPDPVRRAELRRRYGLGPDTPLIVYAGRLCEQKRPRIFAQVMRTLAESGAEFRALVAGDGPDRPWLEEFLRVHALQTRIRLVGEASIAEMRDIFSAADIFFLPSQWEGIALTIYEAMSMELAVVGADVGGQRELVTDGCGLLLPRGSDETGEVAGYAAALGGLLAAPEQRRAMGRRARQRIVAHFQLDRMGQRMVELFDRARALHAEAPRPTIGPAFGAETALRALEYLRVSEDLAWLCERSGAASPPPAPPAAGDGNVPAGWHDLVVQNELQYIENSRAWRLVQRLKRNPLYRLTARLRFGPDWELAERAENPAQRLARIKNSNAYRLIQAVKRTPPYRWYAERKYGPEYRRALFGDRGD